MAFPAILQESNVKIQLNVDDTADPGRRDAIRHLVSLGHRRIGFVLGPRDTSTSLQRFEGATRELASLGQSVSPELLIWSNYSHEAGYSGLLLLAKEEKTRNGI